MLREKRFLGKLPSDLVASELATWGTCHNGHGYDNPPGARLLIDNFTLYSPHDSTPTFEWRMPVGSLTADGYSYVFDQSETTIPPEVITTRDTQASFTEVAPGRWHLHLRARSAEGKWGPTAHFRIDIE